MNEKNLNNVFRFSLYQENVLLCERIFDADKFNPFTRYSINIRDILPNSIIKLQKVLSKKNYNLNADVGRVNPNDEDSDNIQYNLYNEQSEIEYNPKPIIKQIENKTIRGVECKIGLYINENPIVERLFYVDGFNPIARWSVDLESTVTDVVDIIFNQIKKADLKNMWDDYELIRNGFTINQIREFTPEKRNEILIKYKLK